MKKVVRITESELIRSIESVLFKEKNYLSTGDNLLEFTKKLYLIDYNTKGITMSIEDQRNLFENLIPKKRSLVKEYHEKFDNPILTESDMGVNHINKFFDFLKLNSYPMLEQTTPKKPVTPANVNVIIQNLHKAFDGAGTDEDLAVKTIKMINTKDVLTKVDQTIKNTVGKKYPKIQTLAAWINDEMSEIDPKQYDAIWGHLTKMGYKGKESNKFLRAVGKGKELIQKGWDWLKSSTVGKFFNGLRDALNSGWGMAAQLFIDALGPDTLGIAFAIPAVVWGLLFQWDVINLQMGTPEWLNFIFDGLSLATAGIITNALAPIKMALPKGAVFSKLDDAIKWLMTTKFGKIISGWLPKIKSGLGKVGSFITKAAEWVVTKFSKFIGKNMTAWFKSAASKAAGWVTSIADTIGQYAGKQVTKATAKQGAATLGEKLVGKFINWADDFFKQPQWLQSSWVQKGLKKSTSKLVDDYVVKYGKEYGKEQLISAVDKNFGPIYGDYLKFGLLAKDLKGEHSKLLSTFSNFKPSEVNKMLKFAKTSGKAVKSEIGTLSNTQVKGKDIYASNLKNIRQGSPKDANQYKKVGNTYYFAPKNQKVPNWKPVTKPEAVKYLNNYVFKDLGAQVANQMV